MKIKSERDFWSGLMFIIVGALFAIGAMNYGMGPACSADGACADGLQSRFAQLSAHPGAGYFPLGLGLMLVVLGLVVLFKALTIESEGGDPIGAIAWRPLLVIVAAIALFGALLEPLGLALTIPVLIVISSLASDEFKVRDVLISAFVLTLCSCVIFVSGLELAIPVWPWFVR